MENRSIERQKAEYPCSCNVYTSHRVDNISTGKIKNFSKFGVYAELQDCFKDGTILILKAPGGNLEPLPEKIEEGLRSLSLVEVKWSTLLTTDGIVCFGKGLKHLTVENTARLFFLFLRNHLNITTLLVNQ